MTIMRPLRILFICVCTIHTGVHRYTYAQVLYNQPNMGVYGAFMLAYGKSTSSLGDASSITQTVESGRPPSTTIPSRTRTALRRMGECPSLRNPVPRSVFRVHLLTVHRQRAIFFVRGLPARLSERCSFVRAQTAHHVDGLGLCECALVSDLTASYHTLTLHRSVVNRVRHVTCCGVRRPKLVS